MPCTTRFATLAATLFVGGLLIGHAGCAGSGRASTGSVQPRTVTPESFVAAASQPPDEQSGGPVSPQPVVPDAPVAAAKMGAGAEAGASPARRPTTLILAGPPDSGMDTTALVGAPVPSPAAKPGAADPIILESLIGQINGRPVFASEILEPLNDQLRVEAGKVKDRREFRTFATKLIAEGVWRVVKDELILAEARASLTPEQKQGLFVFLAKLQEDVVSQQRGSAVAADEALRSGSGQSLQQAAQDRLNRELILNELRQRVAPRVIVTPRQIQQEYERNFDKYNPRPVATFRLIVVDAGNAEAIERVRNDLAAGRSFDEIADSDLNSLAKARGGGRIEVELKDDPAQALFAIKGLSDAARGLDVGQHAGPVIDGGAARWVRYEARRQERAVSLYEAQLPIEAELREKRFQSETERYFDRLRKRGSVSNIEDMVVRLLYIAEQRYLGPAAQ